MDAVALSSAVLIFPPEKKRENTMKIIRTKQLDLHQLEDLHALETACRSHDQTSLTFPTEDGCLFFLLYDEETLLSAFSAIFNEFETCSCSAFTLPSCRRRGHFTRLLEELLKESGECDLLFLADDSCADAKHTLDAIGAELLNQEHMMELRLPAPSPGLDSRAVKVSPALSPRDEDTLYTIHVNDQPAGSFHLIFQNETVYFYGFEIQEPLRNQGIGTRAAAALIEELTRSARPQPEDLPVSRVLLQVSGDNEPALALYRKLGFAFTETLSYYVY